MEGVQVRVSRLCYFGIGTSRIDEFGHFQPVPQVGIRALECRPLTMTDWIRKVIFPDIFDEPPLRELVEQLRRNVEEDLGAAMQSFVVEQSQSGHQDRT